MKSLLGLDPSQEIDGISLSFRGGWFLALILIAAAIAFAVYLYRSETRLTRGRRIALGVCQAITLLLIILIILQPIAEIRTTDTFKRTMLVLLDTSRSMAIEDQRTTPEQVAEAASALGKIQPGESLDPTRADTMRAEIGTPSRIDLARAALQDDTIGLHGKLAEKYQVRFFTFDETLQPKAGEDDLPWGAETPAEGESSQIGTALDEAVSRFAGQPVAGAIVVSDFNWVEGKDPTVVAKNLKARGIPAYPLAVGVPAPPDIRVLSVIGPEVVFKGDRVPLRIKLDSSGYKGRTIELSLSINGTRATSQQVSLEDGVQFEEMMFIPEQESGTLELEVAAGSLAGETSDSNNTAQHNVRILDEKIKVLYVEGMPRWEYRYLRWVLLRDPRLQVEFLMTQGDPALAAASPRHVGSFPQEPEDIQNYDLIILGDVPASYFSANQLAQIEEQIKTRGGSLLMVAGPMAAPVTYRDTAIGNILPVNIGTGWDSIQGNIAPIVTAAGRDSLVTSLSLSPETSDRVWSHVRPMGRLPQLQGAKPGATVLLTLPKRSADLPDYPLVAWQRYGTGKSMFVGTEDLWRMRYEVGDRYHARFWGQAIQFLTLSRLLGQNKQITIETDRGSYSSGEQVRIYANVLTESFEPVIQSSYEVVLEEKDTPDSSAVVELTPVPGTPGLYSASELTSADGSYIVRTHAREAEISNRAEFEVATRPLEDRDTAMKSDVARQIAELSGGKPISIGGLAGFPGELGEEAELSNVVIENKDLWDVPLLFLLIVLFAGIEWYLRRKDNLV